MLDLTAIVQSKPRSTKYYERIRQASNTASTTVSTYMAEYVAYQAKILAPVETGELRDSIFHEEGQYVPIRQRAEARAGADVPYAIYVELGFVGHFVPFITNSGLYDYAIRAWGWRIPDPDKIKNLKKNQRYLIPRGKKDPVHGIEVSGTAKPFLRPAAADLDASGFKDRWMTSEHIREFKEIGLI